MPDAERVVSERFGVVLVVAEVFWSADCDLMRVNFGSDALWVGCDLEVDGEAEGNGSALL